MRCTCMQRWILGTTCAIRRSCAAARRSSVMQSFCSRGPGTDGNIQPSRLQLACTLIEADWYSGVASVGSAVELFAVRSLGGANGAVGDLGSTMQLVESCLSDNVLTGLQLNSGSIGHLGAWSSQYVEAPRNRIAGNGGVQCLVTGMSTLHGAAIMPARERMQPHRSCRFDGTAHANAGPVERVHAISVLGWVCIAAGFRWAMDPAAGNRLADLPDRAGLHVDMHTCSSRRDRAHLSHLLVGRPESISLPEIIATALHRRGYGGSAPLRTSGQFCRSLSLPGTIRSADTEPDGGGGSDGARARTGACRRVSGQHRPLPLPCTGVSFDSCILGTCGTHPCRVCRTACQTECALGSVQDCETATSSILAQYPGTRAAERAMQMLLVAAMVRDAGAQVQSILGGMETQHVSESIRRTAHTMVRGYERFLPRHGLRFLPKRTRATDEEMERESMPVDALLGIRNYPNGFSEQTTIEYWIPEEMPVSVRVYNVLGQSIATLADGVQRAGRHTLQFTAAGSLPSGLYLAVLSTSYGMRTTVMHHRRGGVR
jgi:hypothetical protein